MQLMSSAVEVAMQDDVTFRRGLPLGCLNYTGRHNKPDTVSGDVYSGIKSGYKYRGCILPNFGCRMIQAG